MATRDQMIAEALKEVKEGLKELGGKLDTKLEGYSREMSDFKIKYADEMATLRTQVKIYAGLAGTIGAIIGGALAKYIVK